MAKQSLSILVEEDEPLPVHKQAGGAIQSGLLALGTVMPQSLALVAIAYAPLTLLGIPLNPLWTLWSAIAGITLLFLFTRERGAVYAVRPGAAVLYASTVTTCATLAPALKLQPLGVLGLAAACMTLAAVVIWIALRTGATRFARYLPAPVGRGLSLGFGLAILWLQVKAVGGWFVTPDWQFTYSKTSIATAILFVVFLVMVLNWRRKMPSMPYLLAFLPVSVGVVWGFEYATGLSLGWVGTPELKSPLDLLPPVLPPTFAEEIARTELSAWGGALTVLVGQALFVAFTFMVDSAGNAASIESMTGDSYDLDEELGASALTMALLPWFGLLPASSLVGATRPQYDVGFRNGRAIRTGNLVVVLGLVALLGLAWVGLNRIPTLFVVTALVVIGINLLDASLFERAGKGVGQREMWWQTWLIGAVFVLWSGIFAMLAGFAVAVAQLVRGAEGTVVRSVFTLKEIRSRRWRSDEEEAVIRRAGARAVVVALQGTLSFAVARRIREEISRIVNPEQMDVLLIDAQRVVHWDVTALEAFKRMADEFQRVHIELMLSHPTEDARKVLQETVKLFSNSDKALEWAENEVLRRQGMAGTQGKAYAKVTDLPLFAPLSEAGRNELAGFGKVIAVASGHPVFNVGDSDGSLLVVLAGNVSIEATGASEALRVATFSPGMVFGEMAFLDGSPRSARANAVNSCLLFYLTRNGFDQWAGYHPKDAQVLLNALAMQIAHRLRFTTGQLIALNP
jgi:SulP family sulfate permease